MSRDDANRTTLIITITGSIHNLTQSCTVFSIFLSSILIHIENKSDIQKIDETRFMFGSDEDNKDKQHVRTTTFGSAVGDG